MPSAAGQPWARGGGRRAHLSRKTPEFRSGRVQHLGQPLPRGVLGGVVLGARTRCCSHLGRPAIPSPTHQQVLTSRCWPPTPASLDSRPRSPSPLGAPSLSLLAGRPFPVTLWQTSSTALCLSWDPSSLLLFELFHHVLFFLKKITTLLRYNPHTMQFTHVNATTR